MPFCRATDRQTGKKMSAMNAATTLKADVLVVGGGLTGLAQACALGAQGVIVVLIERRPLAALVEPSHDGRVTAIARGGKLLLERIDAWRHLEGGAEPIRDIVVGEAGSPVRVHYDRRLVGDAPLGFIVENRLIRAALMARLAELPEVTVVAPGELVALERGPAAVRARLADGRNVQAALLAACEGRGSGTREAAGIGVQRWHYHQTAFVCSFAHPLPHGGRALERFFPDGPFAFLPQHGSEAAPHRS